MKFTDIHGKFAAGAAAVPGAHSACVPGDRALPLALPLAAGIGGGPALQAIQHPYEVEVVRSNCAPLRTFERA